MKNIIVGENTSEALRAITSAEEAVTAEVSSGSCGGGVVMDLIALSNALAQHPYPTTLLIRGAASLIPATGADKVVIAKDAVAWVRPLTMSAYGDSSELKKAQVVLDKLSVVVSDAFEKWPEIKRIFDKGDERFIGVDDARRYGIIK